MNEFKLIPYTSKVWDENILSYLDIDSEGRVITADKWVALWSLNFNFIETVDMHLENLLGAHGALSKLIEDHNQLTAEHAVIVANQERLDDKLDELDTTLEDTANQHEQAIGLVQESKDIAAALKQEFVHYGTTPPTNPNTKLWVQEILADTSNSNGLIITPAQYVYYEDTVFDSSRNVQDALNNTSMQLAMLLDGSQGVMHNYEPHNQRPISCAAVTDALYNYVPRQDFAAFSAIALIDTDIDAIEMPEELSIERVPSTYLMKAYVDAAVSPKYELIETIEVTEDMVIRRTEEPDGTPYNFKRVRMWVETTATDFALLRFSFKSASNLEITTHDFSALSNNTLTRRSWCEIYSNCGMWANRQIAWTQYNGYTTIQESGRDFVVSTEQAPTICSILTTTAVTAGTTIKIWGVRA